MSVLVFGQSGQVAQALSHVGAERGLDVITVGRPRLDFLRPDTVLAAVRELKPRFVINAAAFTAVDAAEEQEAEALQVNASVVAALARVLADDSIPFVHFSTDYVFDGMTGAPYSEGDGVRPINAYGRTKLTGEQMVLRAHPKSFVFRVAWVYGPFGRTLWTTYLDKMRAGEPFVGVSDQFSTPTSSLHLADCVFDLYERCVAGALSEDAYGLYHLAGVEGVSRFDMGVAFRSFCQHLEMPVVPVDSVTADAFGRLAVRPKDTRLDSTLAFEKLGFALPHISDALKDFVERVPEHVSDLVSEDVRTALEHQRAQLFAETTSARDVANDSVQLPEAAGGEAIE